MEYFIGQMMWFLQQTDSIKKESESERFKRHNDKMQHVDTIGNWFENLT